MSPLRFDFSAPTTIPFLAGVGVVVLLIILHLGWRSWLRRLARREDGAVAVPVPFFVVLQCVLGLVVALAALTSAFTALYASWTSFTSWVAYIGAFFYFITYLVFVTEGAVIANSKGLRVSHFGITRRRLSWEEIVWVYLFSATYTQTTITRYAGSSRSTTMTSTRRIRTLLVEGLKSKIGVSANRMGALTVLKVIERRAPQALVGYDKKPVVERLKLVNRILSADVFAAKPDEWAALKRGFESMIGDMWGPELQHYLRIHPDPNVHLTNKKAWEETRGVGYALAIPLFAYLLMPLFLAAILAHGKIVDHFPIPEPYASIMFVIFIFAVPIVFGRLIARSLVNRPGWIAVIGFAWIILLPILIILNTLIGT